MTAQPSAHVRGTATKLPGVRLPAGGAPETERDPGTRKAGLSPGFPKYADPHVAIFPERDISGAMTRSHAPPYLGLALRARKPGKAG